MAKVGRRGIPYQEVARACTELEVQNETISVRKVVDLTGGSFSTVSEHIRKWHEHVSALRDSKVLPEELITALKTAYVKMFSDERKLNETEIARERKILDEALKQVVDLESEQEKLNKELEKLNQYYRDIAAGYERKLAAAESRVTDSEKREKDLSAKLDELREKLKQSEIKVAVAEMRSSEYEKQLLNLNNK